MYSLNVQKPRTLDFWRHWCSHVHIYVFMHMYSLYIHMYDVCICNAPNVHVCMRMYIYLYIYKCARACCMYILCIIQCIHMYGCGVGLFVFVVTFESYTIDLLRCNCFRQWLFEQQDRVRRIRLQTSYYHPWWVLVWLYSRTWTRPWCWQKSNDITTFSQPEPKPEPECEPWFNHESEP